MDIIFIFIPFTLFFSIIKSQNTNSYQNVKDSIILSLADKKLEIEINLNQLNCDAELSKCLNNILNTDLNCDNYTISIEHILDKKDLITINSTETEISSEQCDYFFKKFKSLNKTLVNQISKLNGNINNLRNKIFNLKNKIHQNNLESDDQKNFNNNKINSIDYFFEEYAKNSDTIKTEKLNSNSSENQKINSNIIQFDIKNNQNEIKNDENMKYIQRKLNVLITTLNTIQNAKKKILLEYERQKKICKIAEKKTKIVLNMTKLDRDKFSYYKSIKINELKTFINSTCSLQIKENNLCESFYKYCKNQRIKLIYEKEEIDDFLLYLKK